MRKLTFALSLTAAMLLSLPGAYAAEMNKDTMMKPADMKSAMNADPAMNSLMKKQMDKPMKDSVDASMDGSMDASMDASMKKDTMMAPKAPMMKSNAMDSSMNSDMMKKDTLMGSKK